MLYIIGLGLGWKDLSLKALEALHKCDEVYLESYTSVSNFTVLQLEKLIGKKVRVLDRKAAEEDMPYLKNAHLKEVAVLIYGDPLSATTHFEILAEARKRKLEVSVIHAPSVFTAVAETGLSLYRFGKVASIPIPERNFSPESFFDVLKDNLSIDAHTLFLLDLKPEQNKFLTIAEVIKILLGVNKKRNEKIFTENTFVIGCARLGCEDSIIKAGKASEIAKVDFGKPPFCLVVPARLNHKEEEFISKSYKW